MENNLKTLKIEQIPLAHLRRMPGSDTPFEESLRAMFEMQKEGKILHVGLSNINPEELGKALTMGNIASVENAFIFSVFMQGPHFSSLDPTSSSARML